MSFMATIGLQDQRNLIPWDSERVPSCAAPHCGGGARGVMSVSLWESLAHAPLVLRLLLRGGQRYQGFL